MKNSLYIFLLIGSIITACNNDPRAKLPQTGSFGESFTSSADVKDVNQIDIQDSSIFQVTQISGIVEKYCKGEGCWLTLKQGENSNIRVETKNKSFILPRNIDGKKAIANGHFVKDSSDNNSEITFEATGILIE